ncbi:MAG: ferritin-like domain-containing protein [Acidimicrobiales bacterium]
MSPRKHEILQGSEAELSRLTRDLDQMHRDESLPALQASVSSWTEAIRDERAAESRVNRGRRTFLLGAGAVAGAAALAACGSNNKTTGSTSTSSSTASSTTLSTADMQQVSVDASLENLAVYAYGAVLTAAGQGKYGTVPPAVATFVTTAKGQHADHAAAWNAILTGAGGKANTANDAALVPTVNSGFAAATTLPAVVNLALTLEGIAAATYQVGAANFAFHMAATTAATIMPVEMQHMAILYFVIGKYPGFLDSSGNPLGFSTVASARTTSDYAAS